MSTRRTLRFPTVPGKAWLGWLLVCLVLPGFVPLHAQALKTGSTVVLDRVVAVVNNQAILTSDLDNEMRLSVLEPAGSTRRPETPREALQRLISRSLIRQQIREEDAQVLEPSAEDVASRLADLRRDLPACVRLHCTTDTGWKTFLTNNDLTQQQVENYLRRRVTILRFIEIRFRQGIRIPREEVEAYYHNTLLPQYPQGQAAPPLDQVTPRIEEILLQQHVNALFSDWLENLRKQGEIEVLDPALEGAAITGNIGGASQ